MNKTLRADFFLYFDTGNRNLTEALIWLLDCAGKKTMPSPPSWLPWPAEEIAEIQGRRHIVGDSRVLEFSGEFLSGDMASVVIPLLPYIRRVHGQIFGLDLKFDPGSCTLNFSDGGSWSATTASVMAAALTEGL